MSGLDIEGVLAAHDGIGYDDCDGCTCGADVQSWAAHRAHVAAAVNAEVGRWLTSEEAEASAASGVEDYAYPGLSASECEQAARAALCALAEQLAPARWVVSGREYVVAYEGAELHLSVEEYHALRMMADHDPVETQRMALEFLRREEARAADLGASGGEGL